MLQETILQQKVERNKLIQIDYQPRCYHEQVEKYLKSNLMKLITGPRRAGKSVFSLLLLRGNVSLILISMTTSCSRNLTKSISCKS